MIKRLLGGPLFRNQECIILLMDKKDGGMNYQVVSDDLKNLFEATANKLEREWPARYRGIDSARTIFFMLIRISTNTYNTIKYIIADIPRDPLRKPVYAFSIPPLSRTLFETLVTILFLLEDLPKHINLFMKTGYVQRRLDLEHSQKYYGTSAEWQRYINAQTTQIASEEKEFNLTAQEIAKPKKEIGLWPTPGQILRRLQKDHPQSTSIPFIEYVNSWLYRELSGLTHISSHGLIMNGMYFSTDIAKHLYGDRWEETINYHLEYNRTKQIYIAIALMLSIVTEIELHFKYDLDKRAKYLWTYFGEHSGIVKEIYDTRYSSLLP
jgi:hypothetical protein